MFYYNDVRDSLLDYLDDWANDYDIDAVMDELRDAAPDEEHPYIDPWTDRVYTEARSVDAYDEDAFRAILDRHDHGGN